MRRPLPTRIAGAIRNVQMAETTARAYGLTIRQRSEAAEECAEELTMRIAALEAEPKRLGAWERRLREILRSYLS